MRLRINWDALGITSSVVCAVHCAVLPFVISTLPIFGVNIVDNAGFENGMILLAFVIGCVALYDGIRKHHRSFLPVLIFSIGILLLVAKQAWHELQFWFLIPAISCILTAHLLNYSLTKNARTCKVKNDVNY